MNIYTFIIGMLGPIVVRVVIALGFTAVTYTGITVLLESLVATAQANWSALPTTVLQLATLSGIPTVMGMIFGAYAARVALWAASSATKYVLKA